MRGHAEEGHEVPREAEHSMAKSQAQQTGRCLSHLPCLPGIFCSRAFAAG